MIQMYILKVHFEMITDIHKGAVCITIVICLHAQFLLFVFSQLLKVRTMQIANFLCTISTQVQTALMMIKLCPGKLDTPLEQKTPRIKF